MPMTPRAKGRSPRPPSEVQSGHDVDDLGHVSSGVSMRVPRGPVPSADDHREEYEWRLKLAEARVRAEAEERGWQAVIATARARAEAEEREWQAVMATARARADAEEREWQAQVKRVKAQLAAEEQQQKAMADQARFRARSSDASARQAVMERAQAATRLAEDYEWQRRIAAAQEAEARRRVR